MPGGAPRGIAKSSAYHPRSHQMVQEGAQQRPSITTVTPPVAAAEPPQKAFAGFQQQSGVSPYMNLYRRDNLGTIDNYTTLVRPQLEAALL